MEAAGRGPGLDPEGVTHSPVLVPGRGLAAVLRALPMLHDEGHARACGLPEDTLVLPSSGVPAGDRGQLSWGGGHPETGPCQARHYGQYHGFVVIHGTDTMAFAASVLSFMLENLQKTVILTGAQVPIHALWNDGRENLLGALLLAGQYVIPEVCLFFQNQLFRGNRATKVDTRRFAAFCSPHLPPLATVGADVTINRELVRRVRGQGRLVVHSSMERDPDLLQELRAAAERGLLIVNCTHCLQGAVTSDYGAGTEADDVRDALAPSLACAAAHAGDREALQALAELGSDLSLEDFGGQTPLHSAARGGQAGGQVLGCGGRALWRMCGQGCRVGQGLDRDASEGALSVRARLASLRGAGLSCSDGQLEVTADGHGHQGVIGLLRAAGACLSPQELEDSGTELCRADCEGLRAWWQAGADLKQPGYDGRSALH
ncbi:hypothetical protein E2I00_006061, partial [Balaenoptera physalus]